MAHLNLRDDGKFELQGRRVDEGSRVEVRTRSGQWMVGRFRIDASGHPYVAVGEAADGGWTNSNSYPELICVPEPLDVRWPTMNDRPPADELRIAWSTLA